MVTRALTSMTNSSCTTRRVRRAKVVGYAARCRIELSILADQPISQGTVAELHGRLHSCGARRIQCAPGAAFAAAECGAEFHPVEFQFEFDTAVGEDIRAVIHDIEDNPGWDVRILNHHTE